MADLRSRLLNSGWSQKTVALLGLALLASLDAPATLVEPLASLGTACTLRALASRPFHPRAMAWIAGICFCFSGMVSWILEHWLPVPQTYLFLGALAFMIIIHKRFPAPMPCSPGGEHHP